MKNEEGQVTGVESATRTAVSATNALDDSPDASESDPDFALAKMLQEQEHAWFMASGGDPNILGFEDDPDDEDVEEAEAAADHVSTSDAAGSNDLQMAVDLQQNEYREHLRNVLTMMEQVPADEGEADASAHDLDAMSYEELQALGDTIGKVQVGVSKTRMDQLGSVQYEDLEKRSCTDTKCAVCQCQFEGADEVTPLPCRHVYHTDCISQWLTCSKQCPICSTEVEA